MLNADSSPEDKLRAAKAAIAGILGSVRRMCPKFPESLLMSGQHVLDDKWDEFVLFEEEDQPKVDEVKKALQNVIDVLDPQGSGGEP